MKSTTAILLLVACAHTPPPQHVQTPQGRIFFEDGGRGGIPVVLVHGNGANLEFWRAQLQHLRRSRRSIAYDLRGMGRSDVPALPDYSMTAMGDDLARLVNTLQLERFVLIGHSYGGSVAAHYAAAHPERVAGLVLVDAAGDLNVSRQEAEAFLESLRINKHEKTRELFEPILKPSTPAVRAAVLAAVDGTSHEVFVGTMSGYMDFSMSQAIRTYTGPKLAIAATATEQPMSFHLQFRDVPVRRMEGVGHWLMMDRPAEFNRILDEFLARIDRGATR